MNSFKGFKKATLKFYGEERFDHEYCVGILKEFLADKDVLYTKVYYDYAKVNGFHFNFPLKSYSYKNLRSKYVDAGPKKDKRLYLWMRDIEDTDQFCDWITYCGMRQATNYRNFMPIYHNGVPDQDQEICTPVSDIDDNVVF